MSLKIELAENGWAELDASEDPDYPVTVARQLGRPVSGREGRPIHILTPKNKENARPGSYSSLFGFGAFPLHTDAANWTVPPRYLVLQSRMEACPPDTLLVDVHPILSEFRAPLQRALYYAKGGHRGFYCHAIERRGADVLRWDPVAMKPMNAFTKTISEDWSACLTQLRPIARPPGTGRTVLVIDNWRLLHTRPELTPTNSTRALGRVYVV